MTDQQLVDKPQQRSDLRKFLGKEFFIVKRQVNWLFGDNNFAPGQLTKWTVFHSHQARKYNDQSRQVGHQRQLR